MTDGTVQQISIVKLKRVLQACDKIYEVHAEVLIKWEDLQDLKVHGNGPKDCKKNHPPLNLKTRSRLCREYCKNMYCCTSII